MIPLVVIDTGKVVTGGLFPDLPTNQSDTGSFTGNFQNIPAIWAGGKNVLFASNGVQKLRGWTEEGDEGRNIQQLLQAYVNGQKRVFVGSSGHMSYWLNGVSLDLTPVAGLAAGTAWSMVSWGTWLIATNNVDPPQIWKNSGINGLIPLGGYQSVASRAKLLKKLKNFLVAYGTDEGGSEVRWSDVSDPETWVAAEDNQAGGLFLRDLDSDIASAQVLAGSMGIYTADSLTVQTFIGGQDIFSFDTVLNGIGAVSDGAIIPVGRKHYGLGPNGFFTTDGTTYNYIDEPMVSKWYQDNADPVQAYLTVGFHHKLRKMAVWYFPCKDGSIQGLAYKYADGTWTINEVPILAGIDEQEFGFPLIAVGHTWGFYDTEDGTAIGANFVAELTTNNFDATKPENFKRWDSFRPQVFDQSEGLQVRFGFNDRPIEAADITDWTEWADVDYDNWIGREAVQLTVQFRSTSKSAQWRLGGFTILGEVMGYRV